MRHPSAVQTDTSAAQTASLRQLDLPFPQIPGPQNCGLSPESFRSELMDFNEFGTVTERSTTHFDLPAGGQKPLGVFINEFWTSKQRAANTLHEISYRACFKPQLPRFFIERLTVPGSVVYDPFMGRGTTVLEAALLQRLPWGCDINPLSAILLRPRLQPPSLDDIERRLAALNLSASDPLPEHLLVFYHPDTLREILALRTYFLTRRAQGALDLIDDWICMVALNRLTGHSAGFFSVYTLPPNQAVSVESQRKINHDRSQTPPQRDVRKIILKKSRSLLQDVDPLISQNLTAIAPQARLLTALSNATTELPSSSVDLVVTSPPFLNVVDYATDNWLRCWFLGIDPLQLEITVPRRPDTWQTAMASVLRELHRLLKPGGYVAFEVGEVLKGTLRLEDLVLPAGVSAGLAPVLVLINSQEFTKTANCWGVANGENGTNTNRIVLFQKEG